jgi:hypothetical protein
MMIRYAKSKFTFDATIITLQTFGLPEGAIVIAVSPTLAERSGVRYANLKFGNSTDSHH